MPHTRIVQPTEPMNRVVDECREHNSTLQINMLTRQFLICDTLMKDFIPIFPMQNGMQEAA